MWDQVSADHMYRSLPAEATDREKDALMVPCDLAPVAAHLQLTTATPTSYVQGPSAYCSSPPEAFAVPLDSAPLWPRPEIVSLPGTDYSIMGHPNSAPSPDGPALTAGRPPQDFYTCVQLMNESGEVHLVPCLPPPYCREFPPPPPLLPGADLSAAEKEEKKKKLADYQARRSVMKEATGGDERSEAAVPLLPVAVDNKG